MEPTAPTTEKPARSRTSATKAPAKKPAKATGAKPASAAKPRTLARTAKRTATPKPPEAVRDTRTAQNKPGPAALSAKELATHVERVWELAKRIGICMFITWDGERQRARPLVATVEKHSHAIWFLTDVEAHKDEQVQKFPIVALAFADNGGNKYVSITGRAEILNDRALVKKLWSPYAKAWWKDADDPAIRIIKVTPQDAELWDNPGGLFSGVAMLAAAVTGRGPKIGDNAKVTL